nr:MAG TPA: DNA polymerase III, alpha subunit [Caudoviricetes sp.]
MFVNLHVHSAKGSLLDSILTTEQIVGYAKRNGQFAIGLSDHGTMYASLNLVNDCQKAGIKPITACEIYECDNHLEQNPDDKYNHLLLIAATTDGLHNLYKIVSEGYINGFYRKPRVSVQWIKNNNLGQGIICLTACQAGRLSRYLEQERYDEAEDFINLLNNTFDYVSLEIQSHPTAQQLKCNDAILKFAQHMKMNYVITSDAHMERVDQLDTHSIFVEISQDREVGENYSGCHLQNEQDIFNYLGDSFSHDVIQCGIDETVRIVNMVDDNIDYELNKGTVMPQAHIPDGYDIETYFRHLVYSTFDEKFGHMLQEEQQKRRDRIEEEIPVLKELDFLNYLLIQHEFCNECDKRGIPRGYSRGSAANCLCVFMLGITQIDSVRWNLDFSRFANIGRKGSVADIDLDISKSRRQEAIKVLCDIFGADHVAPMATFNTLSTKVAIKDIAKVLNEKEDSPYFGQIPYSIRDEIAKMIPTVKTLNDLGEEEEKETLLKDLVGKNEKLDKYYKQFPLLFKYVMELEGLPKSRGRHASGTLLTPKPVIHYSPLCLDNEKNVMSMFDMHICQDTKGGCGLCKEDLLGLETLDIVDMALKNAGLTWKDVDINHINLDDKRVYDEVYKTGYTVNVFQMESFDARNMLIEAQASNIEDIIIVNAANRPGTKDSFPDYCKNKLHPDKAVVIHPDLKKLFSQSQNVLMYQEQALSLLRYAGFPEEKVENGRRAIGKKIESEMKTLKPMFEDGLRKKDWGDEQIEAIWNLLLKQSSYCFNR